MGLNQTRTASRSLGSFDRMADQTKSWRSHSGKSTGWSFSTDAEADDSEREPSLGSLGRHPSLFRPHGDCSQEAGAQGSSGDREIDAGDAEEHDLV